MGYLRFLWTAIFGVCLLIISIPVLLIDLVIGLFSMKARDSFTMWIIGFVFSIITFLSGVKIHISGLENIPKDQAVLYIGNHKSFFDVLVTYQLFPGATAFIAKKEFSNVPILSWWMRMMRNLFLDRKDIKQGLKTTLKAIDYVKDGTSICIFPEGTRNKTDEIMLPFHAGSFKIAEKSGCPIIPMTLYNMSAVFEDHMPKLSSEHVFVDFGKPIIISELEKEDKKHLAEYVQGKMIDTYKELKEKHEEINAK